MAVRTSGSEWWTPARWRVGIEIDPSPTRVKTLRVLLELESLESTLESQKKTPIVFDDNTLPERNLSSIVSDSALKIDYLKFLKNQQFYQFLSKYF